MTKFKIRNLSEKHIWVMYVFRFVPYCSSDVWSGNKAASKPKQGKETGGNFIRPHKVLVSKTKSVLWILCLYFASEYTFMGSVIIREVIKDLAAKGLKQAKVVMLAGTRWELHLYLTSVVNCIFTIVLNLNRWCFPNVWCYSNEDLLNQTCILTGSRKGCYQRLALTEYLII